MKRLFVSAGEASGDRHAAAVVQCLREANHDINVVGFGGAELERAGVEIWHSSEIFSVMGIVEVLPSVPAHLKLIRQVRRRFRAGVVDAVLLVDYPGFNLALARAASAAGLPVVYFIPPQVWAWGARRCRRLRRDVTRVASVFSFEHEFLSSRGVSSTFVGHPLLDQASYPKPGEARRELGLPPNGPVLGLFPGSRPQEVGRLWPLFRDTADRLKRRRPDLSVVVAGRPGLEYSEPGDSVIWFGDSKTVLGVADAILCKSGTTTLEAALAGTPMVIAHRVHPMTYAVARHLIRVPWVGLVNLVAGRRVVPEFIQSRARGTVLSSELATLLEAGAKRQEQIHAFGEVRRNLGSPGAARRVAEMLLELAH